MLKFLGLTGVHVLATGLFIAVAASVSAQTYIDSPTTTDRSLFGTWTIGIDDINADGISDLAVASTQEANGEGRCYIFSGDDLSLLQTLSSPTPLQNPPGRQFAGSFFGGAMQVRNSGGSAVRDIAVFSSGETVGSFTRAGRMHIMDPVAGGAPLATLESPNPETDGWFGFGIEVADTNSDGTRDLLVTAQGENAAKGRAYIFSGASPSTVLATIEAPNQTDAGRFGSIVLNFGDVNSDGKDEYVITALNEMVNSQPNAGRVYVFDGATNTVLHTLEKTTAIENDYFGLNIARINSIDSDSVPDIMVVSFENPVNGLRRGYIDVYSGATGAHIDEIDPTTNLYVLNNFGASITNIPDVNDDGIEDIAIGHNVDLFDPYVQGYVSIYSGDDLSYITQFHSPAIEDGDQFAFAFRVPDITGDGNDDLMVGAPLANTDKGRVFLIPLTTPTSARGWELYD